MINYVKHPRGISLVKTAPVQPRVRLTKPVNFVKRARIA